MFDSIDNHSKELNYKNNNYFFFVFDFVFVFVFVFDILPVLINLI